MAEIETPIGDAPVIPVVLLGIGMYLAWFGIHYWRRDVKWPTDPVKAVLQGKGIPAAGDSPSAHTAELAADVTALQPDQGTGAGAAGSGPGGPVQGSYNLAALQTLWTSNGGSQSTSFIAANVAMAESSGNPAATSSNPDGGTNVGLFQLDTKGVGAGYTVAQLKDPNTNTRITVMATANGTNWAEWANRVVVGGKYIGPTQGPANPKTSTL